MKDAIFLILMGGYIALILGFGTLAIVRARKQYRKHTKFVKALKVGDTVMYRNLHFEITEVNNPHIGPLTSIRIKTEGWLNKEDFGFLRPVK
jgi:preprotein translocase subunit YajC